MSRTGRRVVTNAKDIGAGAGALLLFQLWTTCLVLLCSTILPKSTIVSGQGLTHAELTEPVGLQAKKDIADMFNTNPNRLYDDFDGNTIYHKFHPVDDYVPPLPLPPSNMTARAGGGPGGTGMNYNYRPSLAEDSDGSEGYDSNPLLKKPSGPIAYHYDIIPPRPRPKTPPTPITISSSSSPEPDNDIAIVKRQIPASASASGFGQGQRQNQPVSSGNSVASSSSVPSSASSSQSQLNTRFELFRPQANSDVKNLPSFQTLQPDRSASFIPLRVIPGSNSGPTNRDPYVTYGVYTNNPNALTGSGTNAPIFVPINNNAAARQWVPQNRPMYAPEPNRAPPLQPIQFNNQIRPRQWPQGQLSGAGAIMPQVNVNGRNNFRPIQSAQPAQPGPGPGFNSAMAFERRPQFAGQQLRFPPPIPPGYNNNNGMPQQQTLPPPPPYPGARGGSSFNAGTGQRLDSLFFPRPGPGPTATTTTGMANQPNRPPPPSYGSNNNGPANGPTLTSLLGSPPLTSMNSMNMNALQYRSSPFGGFQPPPMWRPDNARERQMPLAPSYNSDSSSVVRPYSSFPSNSNSNRPYYNQSPPMGYFLPPQKPGAYNYGGGRQQQQPVLPFVKTEPQEPAGWQQWQGAGYGHSPFDDGKRPRTTPYSVPSQGLYPSPTWRGADSLLGPFGGGGLQPAAYRRPYGNYAAENRLPPWTTPSTPGTNQPNQFSNIQPTTTTVQPIPVRGGGSSNTNAGAQPSANPNSNSNINANANVNSGLTRPAFNNSRFGVSDPIGLRTEQRLVEPERTALNSQVSKIPDLSVNRGPVPFYSQADVDGHYRRMLAHNETAADSEFENDPRVLQWYLQRAKQVLQERRGAPQAEGTGGGQGGGSNLNNFNNNARSGFIGGGGQQSVPVFPISAPATNNAATATANENAANANRQQSSSDAAGGGWQGLTLAELLSTTPRPAAQFTRK